MSRGRIPSGADRGGTAVLLADPGVLSLRQADEDPFSPRHTVWAQRALASRAAGLPGRRATNLNNGALAEIRPRRNRQLLLTAQPKRADQGLVAVLVGLAEVI